MKHLQFFTRLGLVFAVIITLFVAFELANNSNFWQMGMFLWVVYSFGLVSWVYALFYAFKSFWKFSK